MLAVFARKCPVRNLLIAVPWLTVIFESKNNFRSASSVFLGSSERQLNLMASSISDPEGTDTSTSYPRNHLPASVRVSGLNRLPKSTPTYGILLLSEDPRSSAVQQASTCCASRSHVEAARKLLNKSDPLDVGPLNQSLGEEF